MNKLFTTEIVIDGENVAYDVVFENEAYHFRPVEEGPAFKVKREEDVFRTEGPLNEIAQSQAVSALQNYLLSQH